MSKRFIYFTGIVLMSIAINAIVSAQENAPLLNDSVDYESLNASVNASSNISSNETSNVDAFGSEDVALNETMMTVINENQNITVNETLNQIVQDEIVVLDEAASAMNATLKENATISDATANAAVVGEESQSEMSLIAADNNAIFSIGSGLASENIFQINGYRGTQQPFDINLPTKPVMDVSKVFFACNII